MFRTRARFVKILFFLALFIWVDWAIEWTALRPKSLTAAVDSVSLATGVGPQLIDDLVVGLVAFVFLQIILAVTDSLRFLTGERKREIRLPASIARADDSAGE